MKDNLKKYYLIKKLTRQRLNYLIVKIIKISTERLILIFVLQFLVFQLNSLTIMC